MLGAPQKVSHSEGEERQTQLKPPFYNPSQVQDWWGFGSVHWWVGVRRSHWSLSIFILDQSFSWGFERLATSPVQSFHPPSTIAPTKPCIPPPQDPQEIFINPPQNNNSQLSPNLTQIEHHLQQLLQRNGETTKILSLHGTCGCRGLKAGLSILQSSIHGLSVEVGRAYKLTAGDHLLPWETQPEDRDALLLLPWCIAIQWSIQKLPGQNS